MARKPESFIDELCHAMEVYHGKWHAFIGERNNKDFFEGLKPTAVAWKVLNRAEFDDRVTSLRELSSQIHFGWVNERWLVTFYLKEECLSGNVRIIKLMERRPGSTDPIGLDHVDFLLPKGDAKPILSKEKDIRWTEEKNGDHCEWLSVWFDGTEAKLRSDTVLQVCSDELIDAQKRLL